MYYEKPPIPADARRLGYLVGRLRTRRDIQRAKSRNAVSSSGVRDLPVPVRKMVRLTPAASGASDQPLEPACGDSTEHMGGLS